MATTTSTNGTAKRDEPQTLKAGQSLGSNEALSSTNGRFRLVMQSDNNLVLYDQGRNNSAFWSSNTYEEPASPKASLGTDGDFVVYNGYDELWSSATGGEGDDSSILKLEDNGNLVIYSNGVKIWETDTPQMPLRAQSNNLKEDGELGKDEALVSTNGKYKLIMQGDGNLVLYTTADQKSIWSTGTRSYGDGVRAALQKDGDFVVYSKDRAEWSSKSKGKPNPLLTLQDDGNLILTSNGTQVWISDSKQRERPAGNRNILYVGEGLKRDEKITSLNNKYYVVFDGWKIRVHKQDGTELWSAGRTAGASNEEVKVRGDGEIEMFMLRDYVGWTLGNGNKGNADCFYIIQDDGNFVLMTNGKQAWHTDTRRMEDGTEPVIDRLRAGESIPQGKKLTSPNRKFELRMQGDGNLVLYNGSNPTWSTQTNGRGWGCDVRDDDTFVVSGSGWSSGVRRRSGGGKGELILQDDGKLIFKTDGYIIWSTDSSLVKPYPPQYSSVSGGANQIKPGERLYTNQSLTSPNGQYTATLQSDGDFVVRHKSSTAPLWRSKTAPNSAVQTIQVQYDDNCVIIGANDSAVWATGSDRGEGDNVLRLKDDGILSIKEWSSGPKFPVSVSANVQKLELGEALLVGQALVSSGGGNRRLTINESGKINLTGNGWTTNHFLSASALSGVTMLVFENPPSGGKPVLALKNRAGDNVWTASLGESSVGQRYRSEMQRWQEEYEKLRRQYGSDGERIANRNKPNPVNFKRPVFQLAADGINATVLFENETVWSLKDIPWGYNDTIRDTVSIGNSLNVGDSIFSQNRAYRLIFQNDGNLVTYRVDGKKVIWASGTSLAKPSHVTADYFGRLHIMTTTSESVWTTYSSESTNSADIVTRLHNDGNLVTSLRGSTIWASGTK